jgi:cytochrome P450
MRLCGDAHLIAVAGSDTTSSATSCLLHQLALNPETCKKLQAEIDDYKTNHEQSDHFSMSKLKYLQACIDESLRLTPVLMSGLQRMTPPGGMQLDDVFIPGDTIFHAPSYTMYRDERCFARPNEFIPERWTTKPELTIDSSVYAPFSTGRGACAGKQLGLMEMRYVLTEILSNYDISLAPGTKPETFIDGLRDCFTLELPELNMVFTPRARDGQKQT